MRRLSPVIAALALAACNPDFDPASKLEKLRVVAIQAEPPELDPAGAQTAALTSLVLRPEDLTTVRTTTVVHLACVPVPGDPNPTACVMLQNLKDPAATIAAVARHGCDAPADPAAAPPWPPVVLAGFEVCVAGACGTAGAGGVPLPPAQVTIPGRLPALLDGSGVERILGVQVVDLAFAVDATPEELVAGVGTACPEADVADNLAALWASREHVLSAKRVPIRGPQSPNPANRNPAVAGIVAGGVPLDPAAATSLAAGRIELTPVVAAAPAGEPEVYTELDAAGAAIEAKTEEWVYSWFSTAGELEDLHTRSTTRADEWTVWDAGPARVVVVVRDLRGGTAWAVRDVVVR